MENKKDIGQAFKEKLDGLDRTPSDAVWKSIESQLPQKRKRRILFWLLALIPTAFVIYTTAFSDRYVNKNRNEHQRLNANPRKSQSIGKAFETPLNSKQKELEITDKPNVGNQPIIEKGAVKIRKETSNATAVQHKIVTARPKKFQLNNKFATDRQILKNNNTKSETALDDIKNRNNREDQSLTTAGRQTKDEFKSTTKIPEPTVDPETQTDSLHATNITKKDSTGIAAIPGAPSDGKKTKLDEDKPFQIYISAHAGPTLYNSNTFLAANPAALSETNGAFNFMFGMNLKVMLTKRFGANLGINHLTLNNMANVSNINGNLLNARNISFAANISEAYVTTLFNDDANIEITQKITYIEFPIVGSYVLWDKTFGVEIIAGGSIFKLLSNSTAVALPATKLRIGELNNLSNSAFSANAGFELNYKLRNRFRLQLIPLFKYQFRVTQDVSTYKPYFFQLQAGINYQL